jgi:hypothetical protein
MKLLRNMADLQFQMTKSIRSTKVFNLSELALIEAKEKLSIGKAAKEDEVNRK